MNTSNNFNNFNLVGFHQIKIISLFNYLEHDMTPETRKILLNLIIEYGNSLTRIKGEKDLIRAIEARAVAECDVPLKAFKLVANAHWKDSVKATQEDLEGQLALFEMVKGGGGVAVDVEFGDAA